MKKAANRKTRTDENMRPEYDFTGGVRGKYYNAMQAGYTITIHLVDGTTVVKKVQPEKGAVILEPDVQRYFPDSESVNKALRNLIGLIPGKHKSATRKAHAPGNARRVAHGKQGKSLRS